jgi:ferric-dicitrate binding protein FerR (iron transport regulator)
MKRWLQLVIALSLLTVAASAQQESQAQPTPGRVAEVLDFKGAVTAQLPLGVASPVKRGETLVANTIVITGKNSSVVLLMLDGSQVLVKANSRLQLLLPDELHERSYLQMAIGQLIAKIKKRFADAPSFRMGTPSAVITVRGTEFDVDVNKKGETEIRVHQGVVEVTGVAPIGGLVNVEAGFGTRVRYGRQPEEPYSLTVSQIGNPNLFDNSVFGAAGMGGALSGPGSASASSEAGSQSAGPATGSPGSSTPRSASEIEQE